MSTSATSGCWRWKRCCTCANGSKPYLDLQLVAFPQDGVLRSPGALANLKRALDLGVDVVGGIPHFERTMADGAESVKILCELAAERGLPVDMHCDESDDPLTPPCRDAGLPHAAPRAAGPGHRLAPDVDAFDGQLLRVQADPADAPRRGLHAVANPLINITLQGRHDTYPKRRGMTRVPELMAAGINVGFGHDCVMDPWYPLGSGDMLEVAQMGLHVAQMTSLDGMRACFDAVTVNNARVLGLDDYGIEPRQGGRLRAAAGALADRGDPPACPPTLGHATRQSDCPLSRHRHASLDLPDRPAAVDWTAAPRG